MRFKVKGSTGGAAAASEAAASSTKAPDPAHHPLIPLRNGSAAESGPFCLVKSATYCEHPRPRARHCSAIAATRTSDGDAGGADDDGGADADDGGYDARGTRGQGPPS